MKNIRRNETCLDATRRVLRNAIKESPDLWGQSPIDLLADNLDLPLASLRGFARSVEPEIVGCTERVRNLLKKGNVFHA